MYPKYFRVAMILFMLFLCSIKSEMSHLVLRTSSFFFQSFTFGKSNYISDLLKMSLCCFYAVHTLFKDIFIIVILNPINFISDVACMRHSIEKNANMARNC